MPIPEDNLWCSPLNPDLPDKYDYQNIPENNLWPLKKGCDLPPE
jgi:hypothetical protein